MKFYDSRSLFCSRSNKLCFRANCRLYFACVSVVSAEAARLYDQCSREYSSIYSLSTSANAGSDKLSWSLSWPHKITLNAGSFVVLKRVVIFNFR